MVYRGDMDQPLTTQTVPSCTLNVDSGLLTAALCPHSGGQQAMLREIADVFGGANQQHLNTLLTHIRGYSADPTRARRMTVRATAEFLAVSLSGGGTPERAEAAEAFCRAITAALSANMWNLTVTEMDPGVVFALANEPWMVQRGVDPEPESDGNMSSVHLDMDGYMALSCLRTFESHGASCSLTAVGVDRFGTRI